MENTKLQNKKKNNKPKKTYRIGMIGSGFIANGIYLALNNYPELEITNITKPNINHNLLIDLKSNSSIYQDSFIYLELTNEMNLLKCFYNLEQL